jgi:hypothetical protein
MIPFGKRLSFAFRSFISMLGSGTIPADVVRETAALQAPPRKPAAPPVEPPDRAIQLLALLQRDGRLVDFFSEDITPYSDEQVGAAARTVHDECWKSLGRYLTLVPVLDGEEDAPVTVEGGFDPAAIKLVGNVGPAPPFRGLLRHGGWRVSRAELPPLAEAGGRHVVAPAEVEIA